MSQLHLVTPGFRPHYIQKGLNHLVNFREYPFTWHLIMDEKVDIDIESFENYKNIKNNLKFYRIPTNYSYGFEQRMYFTEKLSLSYPDYDWCYFLDDDNLVTPDLFTAFLKYHADNSAKFVLLSQIRYSNPTKRLYGREGHTNLGVVDIGNFICRLDAIKGLTFNVCNYSEDGAIVTSLYKKYKDYFKYEDCLVTTYNILQV